jgi:hypothetical protein
MLSVMVIQHSPFAFGTCHTETGKRPNFSFQAVRRARA